jgi:hypothetical protein
VAAWAAAPTPNRAFLAWAGCCICSLVAVIGLYMCFAVLNGWPGARHSLPAKQDPKPQETSKRGTIAAIIASSRANDLRTLRDLIGNGRVLQARFGQFGSRMYELPNDLAVELAQWEAAVSALLVGKPQLAQFHDVPREAVFDESTGSAYDRMSRELEIIQEAINDLENENK